jgi:hypothetical protein
MGVGAKAEIGKEESRNRQGKGCRRGRRTVEDGRLGFWREFMVLNIR